MKNVSKKMRLKIAKRFLHKNLEDKELVMNEDLCGVFEVTHGMKTICRGDFDTCVIAVNDFKPDYKL